MIEIRRGTMNDIDILHTLMQEQFRSHDILVEENTLITSMMELLRRDDLGFFLIAWEEKKALGFAAVSYAWTLEHGGKSAWLDELYVVPERRREGIGGALIDQVIRDARKEKCHAIDLEVDSDHIEAGILYERKGFMQLSRKRWVYQDLSC